MAEKLPTKPGKSDSAIKPDPEAARSSHGAAPTKRAYRRGLLGDKRKGIREPRVRKIVDRLIELDMSQARFCALTKIGPSLFSRWLAAPSIRLDVAVASRIAAALQVTAESVIDPDPNRPLVPVQKEPIVLAIYDLVEGMIRQHGKLETLVILSNADKVERAK